MTPDVTSARTMRAGIRRTTLGYTLFLAVFQVSSLLLSLLLLWLAPDFVASDAGTWVLSLVPLYACALPLLWLVIRKVPAEAPTGRAPFSLPRLLVWVPVCFLLALFGSLLGTWVNDLLSRVGGLHPVDPVTESLSGRSLAWTFAGTVIVAPIMEELVFRKLLCDRLRPVGERWTVFCSGLFFAVLHGNFSQFFYTFFLGLILAALYMRTGRLSVTVCLHALFNFFGGFLGLALEQSREVILAAQPAGEETVLLTDEVVRAVYYLYNYLAGEGILLLSGLVLLFVLSGSAFGRLRPSEHYTRGQSAAAVWGVGTWLFLLLGAGFIFLSLL